MKYYLIWGDSTCVPYGTPVIEEFADHLDLNNRINELLNGNIDISAIRTIYGIIRGNMYHLEPYEETVTRYRAVMGKGEE